LQHVLTGGEPRQTLGAGKRLVVTAVTVNLRRERTMARAPRWTRAGIERLFGLSLG